MVSDDLDTTLHQYGLRQMGDCPDGAGRITLVGPDEPRFWPIFCDSAEYKDGDDDPLDRWSHRVVSKVAMQMNAEPLFPFGGPPYAPFYTWAVQSGRFWPSPIGFLVHDEAGLFASFRGALRWNGDAQLGTSEQPCLTCTGQPCATACPVGAFNDGYDVATCKAHVASAAGDDCRRAGCLARRACPVGQGNRLPAQAAFHMEAFL
ncbi:ferredoxin [Loktanella sp. Alg231-35]|uniref:ferredoxin n=1 Tax=Loktanella sp. Alg231-35 TaxID=1922220 RepID=UPI000D54C60B|nr:ferredoxin [Loktanella sp. Alg231-35]